MVMNERIKHACSSTHTIDNIAKDSFPNDIIICDKICPNHGIILRKWNQILKKQKELHEAKNN